jgi:hypothetical protein
VPIDVTDAATLAIAAAIAFGVWIVVLVLLAVATRAREPDPAPATMELGGDEPPAVVNLITNGWAVGKEAVPATLIDLAARKVVAIELAGADHCVVRVRGGEARELTDYERQVHDHVRTLASDGVVPAEALTTGPEAESKGWWTRFRNAVTADARRRGLSRKRWATAHLVVLGIFAAAPAALAAGAFAVLPSGSSSSSKSDSGGLFGFVFMAVIVWLGLMVVPGSMRAERDTPAGLAAASRWLGLRAQLAGNESFGEQPPAGVVLWDRLLSYGAAMGVAAGAVRGLPMGAESATEAWTSYGGRWRVVRIRYPHHLPPGWGRSPWAAIGVGLVWLVPAGLVAYGLGSLLSSAIGSIGDVASGGWEAVGALVGLLFTLAPVVALVYGATMLWSGAADLNRRAEVEGLVLRRREIVSNSKSGSSTTAVYLAVFDGRAQEVRALRCTPQTASGVHAGSYVRATVSPRLAHAYSVQLLPR